MRRLTGLTTLVAALLCAAANHANAELIRVAIARGQVLDVAGGFVVARGVGDEAGVLMGSTARFEAVGPLVSDGERLAERFELGDLEGRAVQIGGVPALGRPEIIAWKGQLVAVDAIDLETYVASVVGAEMPASWPVEALKAQSVAARTYVLRQLRRVKASAPYDIEGTTAHQVYGGEGSLDPRAVAAVEATRGEVVRYADDLAETYFFSTCAGKTESALAAFGRGKPYLRPVSCEGGEAAPKARWRRRFSLSELSDRFRRAGLIASELSRIEVLRRSSTNRLARVRLRTTRGGSRTVSGAVFRRTIGYGELPSLDTRVKASGRSIVFAGRGSGHGVGLCQWCARGLAVKGDGYRDILSRYYPGTRIGRRPRQVAVVD